MQPKLTSVVYDGSAVIDYLSFGLENTATTPRSIGALADLAVARGWRSVWVSPRPLIWNDPRQGLFWQLTASDIGLDVRVNGMPHNPTALIYDKGKVLARIMRTDDSRWGLQGACAADEALALHELYGAIGGHPLISPSTTGLSMLHKVLEAKGWLPAPITDAFSGEQFTTLDIQFLRKDFYGSQWGYLHLMDRNAAYLAAARSTDFGISGLTAFAPEDYLPDGSGFGVAAVTVKSIPTEAARLLPIKAMKKQQLIAAPVYKLLKESHANFALHTWFAWTQVHRALRPWAEVLINARSCETPGARLAAKRIAIQTIGMFDHLRPTDAQPWFYHPEWRAHIMGINALTFVAKIKALESAGYPVLAANTDMVAVLSHGATPPAMLQERPGSAGAYKLVATHQGEMVTKLIRLASLPTSRIGSWLEEVKHV